MEEDWKELLCMGFSEMFSLIRSVQLTCRGDFLKAGGETDP